MGSSPYPFLTLIALRADGKEELTRSDREFAGKLRRLEAIDQMFATDFSAQTNGFEPPSRRDVRLV